MVCLIGIAVLGYIVAGIPDRLEYYAEPVELKAEPIRQIVEVIPIEIEVVEEDPEPIPEPTVHMTDDDIIAAVVMSEAGNQDLLGKTAVAATILNRADYFDLTIEQVVNAENAYSYPYYGVITAECYRAVEIARENRDLFPATMMYFRTGDYHSFGEHYNKIGDHFFSMIESEG
jgi:spore germination cell wall hydrolase CwlJ-like protein